MCGRYALHSLVHEIQEYFGAFGELDLHPSFNVAPSQRLPIVRACRDRRELALCQWGFIPAWMKGEPRSRPINAKAETAAEKPYFRDAFRRRRCLVPANGFYEWQRQGSRKQPWYFRLAHAPLLAFAGLWDRWEGPAGSIETFTILTTDANEALRPVHDRMPVILEPESYAAWLAEADRGLLTPYRGEMQGYPVGSRVNSPANNDAALLEPMDPMGSDSIDP